MKQVVPCVLMLSWLLLAGCELGTETLPGEQSSGSPTAEPAATAVVATDVPQAGAQAVDSPAAPPLAVSRIARGNLQFVEGYAQGLQVAQAERKPMLVFFTADWCHFCHQMAGEAFTDPQVVNLAQQFVCVLVDADAESEVCRQFRVQAFPTVQFASPRGVPLNRVVGQKPGQQLMMAMQAALQSIARRPATSAEDRPL